MGRWRWFWRSGQGFDGDPTGPATSYAAQHGAYAPGAAPAEQPEGERPDWDAPTDKLCGWPQVDGEQQ